MNTCGRHALACLLLLAVALVWGVHARERATGHLLDKACNTCHLTSSGEVSGGHADKLVASQEQLCGACHADAIRLSHPTGLKPNRALPAAFPLDWKGELTCSSCHDIHGDDEEEMLRGGKSGEAFCTQCHDQKFFEAMADHGDSIQQSGHLAARQEEASVLDAFSLQCLGCHGESGQLVTVRGDMVQHQGSDVAHPIGGVYAEIAANGGYREVAVLPAAIILPDGKVSCISCHQGYATVHGDLVIDNAGSALCLTCHDM